MPCNLSFGAKNYDVDAILASWRINPDSIFRAGERRGRQQYSGFSFVTSTADFDNLEQQILDTINFLRANESSLRGLKQLQDELDDSWLRIDFGFSTRMFDEKVGIQIDSFPSELLLRLGSIGAELMISQYPPMADEHSNEAENEV